MSENKRKLRWTLKGENELKKVVGTMMNHSLLIADCWLHSKAGSRPLKLKTAATENEFFFF